MENKFNIESFSDMISESLCSLTAEEPISVGQTLIAELFQDGSLSDRLNVLRALNEAAFELPGGKRFQEVKEAIAAQR